MSKARILVNTKKTSEFEEVSHNLQILEHVNEIQIRGNGLEFTIQNNSNLLSVLMIQDIIHESSLSCTEISFIFNQ